MFYPPCQHIQLVLPQNLLMHVVVVVFWPSDSTNRDACRAKAINQIYPESKKRSNNPRQAKRQITKLGDIQETKAKQKKKQKNRTTQGIKSRRHTTGRSETETQEQTRGKGNRQADRESRQHTEDVLQRGGDNWTWVTYVRVGQTVTEVGGRKRDENNRNHKLKLWH